MNNELHIWDPIFISNNSKIRGVVMTIFSSFFTKHLVRFEIVNCQRFDRILTSLSIFFINFNKCKFIILMIYKILRIMILYIPWWLLRVYDNIHFLQAAKYSWVESSFIFLLQSQINSDRIYSV